MDKNCRTCKALSRQNNEQHQWFQSLSRQNMELADKCAKQTHEIYTLQNKLQALNMTMAQVKLEMVAKTPFGREDADLAKTIKLIRESISFLEEAETFNQGIDHTLSLFDENTSYSNRMLKFFREAYFKQLKMTNALKRYLMDKMADSSISGLEVITELKEQQENLYQAHKEHYEIIKKLEEDLKTRNEKYNSLKKCYRKLYKSMRQTRAEKDRILNQFSEQTKLFIFYLNNHNQNKK